MTLTRIHIDPRSRDARRDLADPYQMHCTLTRVFAESGERRVEGEFLWRTEPELDNAGNPMLLVQSRKLPDWSRLGEGRWLAGVDPSIDLESKYGDGILAVGRLCRFRLRANPCITRQGKRLGLLNRADQESWLVRKGKMHGFEIPTLAFTMSGEGRQGPLKMQITQERMLSGHQQSGNQVRVYSVLYDGLLRVHDRGLFLMAMSSGIGHGKALGLGLLSVVPLP